MDHRDIHEQQQQSSDTNLNHMTNAPTPNNLSAHDDHSHHGQQTHGSQQPQHGIISNTMNAHGNHGQYGQLGQDHHRVPDLNSFPVMAPTLSGNSLYNNLPMQLLGGLPVPAQFPIQPVNDPSAQLQQNVPTQAHGQALGQSLQQYVPNAVVVAGFSNNLLNAIVASQAPTVPQPSISGLSAPRACSKCRKNGNVAWNTRWRNPDAEVLVRKTFATCNHCKWSPNLANETALEWVRNNAPWLEDDVNAFCSCYWGVPGNHPHPMCIVRTRVSAAAAAAAPAPIPAVLAPAAPAAPASAAPAGPVAPVAPMGPATDADADDGDLQLFVGQDEYN
ncbi:hypothetical protein BDP55DRAFT_718749 [Colletotrichum godetiae]|uniref:Uncharacterized protein n=1 Tax=Colletotrichum godetiae TaxID=1209918 RepID=A0AAJ0ACU9_9PEZI|nr:uncharacterized protein BDP55DRAFT_718749 [Colletotrichum godetiae]KAK1671576.1 hypothetical protein BDP55DRAFT_718749 [Colletotrichum godetiae]